jgi:hypothetical protein
VNNVYDPAGLRERFGKDHLFAVTLGGRTYEMGAVFWFLLVLIASYIIWVLVRRKLLASRSKSADIGESPEASALSEQTR